MRYCTTVLYVCICYKNIAKNHHWPLKFDSHVWLFLFGSCTKNSFVAFPFWGKKVSDSINYELVRKCIQLKGESKKNQYFWNVGFTAAAVRQIHMNEKAGIIFQFSPFQQCHFFVDSVEGSSAGQQFSLRWCQIWHRYQEFSSTRVECYTRVQNLCVIFILLIPRILSKCLDSRQWRLTNPRYYKSRL